VLRATTRLTAAAPALLGNEDAFTQRVDELVA
jgi:hypothetical protein